MSYLSRTQEPVVVSFYTINTPYQLEVLNLIHSCKKFQIEHSIEGKESLGSWEKNCAMKPSFIRDKLLELKRPIFWIDADAAFLKKPAFSLFLNHDMAVREMTELATDRRFKLNAATLFFNYNDKVIDFLNQWCALCEQKIAESRENPNILLYLDQISLLDVMEARRDIHVLPLPIAYCKIFDFKSDLIDPKEVVIEQYQASRRFRDLV